MHKSFDSLWHDSLLYKLTNILHHNWIFLRLNFNFLRNRRVIPQFNNTIAVTLTPLARVPLGSCISPILFNILMNDLPLLICHDTIITQFADDVIHVVTSKTVGQGSKHDMVIRKAKEELANTVR